MAKQQEQSGKKTTDELNYLLPDTIKTEFTGYKELKHQLNNHASDL